MQEPNSLSRAGLAVLLASALFLPACRLGSPPLRVGGRTGTEGTVLCEIAAQHLEKRLGRKVERFQNLGDALQAHQALLTVHVDAYPEYAASALAAILQVDLSPDAGVAVERLRMEYQRRFQVEWLEPLGFDNRVVMVVREGDAGRMNLAALSEAEKSPDGWQLAASRDFSIQRWGMPVLSKHYDLKYAKPPVLVSEAETYRALREGRANLGAGFATDASLSRPEFRVIEDDRKAFAPNPASFVLLSESERKHPGLRKALAELSGRIDLARMRAMNRAVEIDRKPAAEVAAAFLASAGL